jgi:hypothetical protein
MTYRDQITHVLAWLGLAIGAFAICLQFSLTIPASLAAGRNLALSILFFFSFFTILSNIGAMLCHAAQVLNVPALRMFRDRMTAGAITTAMIVVGAIYHLVLAKLWAPQGLFWLCDRLLHTVTPILMVAWWAASATGTARFGSAAIWLIYPLAYVVCVYIRWAFVREVPYPFLDPVSGGRNLAISLIGIVSLFVVVALVTVAIDKLMVRLRSA